MKYLPIEDSQPLKHCRRTLPLEGGNSKEAKMAIQKGNLVGEMTKMVSKQVSKMIINKIIS